MHLVLNIKLLKYPQGPAWSGPSPDLQSPVSSWVRQLQAFQIFNISDLHLLSICAHNMTSSFSYHHSFPSILSVTSLAYTANQLLLGCVMVEKPIPTAMLGCSNGQFLNLELVSQKPCRDPEKWIPSTPFPLHLGDKLMTSQHLISPRLSKPTYILT